MTKFKTLHEAINFVLKKNNNQFMSFEEISNAIEKQRLWERPSNNQFPPPYQIKLRTVVSKKYKQDYTFEIPNKIKLNN